MEIFDRIELVGINEENGLKLVVTILFVALIFVLRWGLNLLAQTLARWWHDERTRFWVRQSINLVTTIVLILGLLSIWFDDPTRLATALGLVTAGLAFALQKVVTSIAGYFIILRGSVFTVGDRITMGGVRGDVIGLGFIQTKIMEMGQPPAVESTEPAMWVRSRQYTGRIVSVSNAQIFDEPVYNYSRDFPYLWDEITLPITYTADRGRAERILLEAADRQTRRIQEASRTALAALQRRYLLHGAQVEPHVYYRLTDNWLELTVRFMTDVRGVRELKDDLSRDILAALDEAGIGIAPATFEIVGLPPLRVRRAEGDGRPT